MKNPYDIIKIDRYTGRIQPPTLLLMNRSFQIIGKISQYENWNISLSANDIDEITFSVHKYNNGELCPIWDDLIDLKIVNVDGFGYFEISVDYTDNSETVKSIHGVSLETELAQISLYEFHVNDDEAADMQQTEYSGSNYDDNGNFIPTVFYNSADTKHSLLHRILADKAPHWTIGHVPDYIALDEESQPEPSSSFQRTYTADGDSIYDFLTGTVAKESNVVFTFDVEARKEENGCTVLQRVINCYNLCSYINPETEYICDAIGEDTSVLISKRKLANEITISSNKDNVKNCFRIEGGDDIISDMVRAINMNGSNYIYQFADFQYNDMSENLRNALKEYQDMMDSEETRNLYYGEEGIYTELCKAYDDLENYESSMMPNTDQAVNPITAEEQYNIVFGELNNSIVAVSSMDNYNDSLFVGVTNNIEAYAQIFLDSRFDLKIVSNPPSYSYNENTKKGVWKGKIQITQHTDESNFYPENSGQSKIITVNITDDEMEFAKQKVQKALSASSIADIDFCVAGMNEEQMLKYFDQYSLNRLKSFSEGYDSCISILTACGQTNIPNEQANGQADSYDINDLYDTYKQRSDIVNSIKDKRQKQVDEINEKISRRSTNEDKKGLLQRQEEFQNTHDLKNYLEDKYPSCGLYKEFCAYRREGTYTNSKYISDNLSMSECLAKAKELVEAAANEARKACILQRTVSTTLNNLFALPEFEPLHEKLALFNYIRIRTEDEILKLRLIGVEFCGDSAEQIQVTFSEQIESIDGSLSDTQSILQQASSMASSYPSTLLQAKQGAQAKNAVLEMYNSGLNAAKTMLTNNDNNEVTFTQSGILCKRMDDEGFYGKKQLRITGNIMAFTDDNWQSVKTAVGETVFTDPTDPEGKRKIEAYGILAPSIVGKFIASEKMYISNEKGSVLITGDGIEITKGLIKSNNYSAIDKTGSVINLTNGTFSFADERLKYDAYRLSVEGNILATSLIATNSGKIANFNFNSDSLYTDYASFGKNGIYLGSSGLSMGDKFCVTAYGKINTTSGTIGKWNITNKSLSYEDELGSILLNSTNKSIVSRNGSKKAVLASGYVGFEQDDIKYMTLSTTFWTDKPEIYGVGIQSEANSKFISFGNKKLDSDTVYITPLVLNYGLNPNGDKQDILLYGTTLFNGETTIKNKISFGNGNAYLHYTYDTNELYCGGSFGIGGAPYSDYTLSVAGDSYMMGDLFVDGPVNVGSTPSEKLPSCKAYIDGRLYTVGAVAPADDEEHPCGTKSYRWSNVYCKNSAIDTSDERKKHAINSISEKYEKLFFNMEPLTYMFNNGDRVHIGTTAQRLKKAMADAGLSDMELSAYCKDVKTKPQTLDNGDVIEVPALDENGIEDYNYGIRYSEFVMLNTHMIQKLYKITDSQQQEINQLKQQLITQ